MPDIVTMAKGIGNGLPLAAVVTTPEISQVMTRKLNFNTFGGNPVVSAGGRAVLQAIDEDGTQQNSVQVRLPASALSQFRCSLKPVGVTRLSLWARTAQQLCAWGRHRLLCVLENSSAAPRLVQV